MFSHSVKVHPGGGGRAGRRDEQKARELDLDALEQTVYASATDLDALEAGLAPLSSQPGHHDSHSGSPSPDDGMCSHNSVDWDTALPPLIPTMAVS